VAHVGNGGRTGVGDRKAVGALEVGDQGARGRVVGAVHHSRRHVCDVEGHGVAEGDQPDQRDGDDHGQGPAVAPDLDELLAHHCQNTGAHSRLL
jgi:hypothetical protein